MRLKLKLNNRGVTPLPSGYGIMFYAPLKTTTLPSIYVSTTRTWVRTGSIHNYVDRLTGLIAAGSANAARFEQDGVLIEPAATNNVLYSNNFTAVWAATRATVTLASTTGPDNTASGAKIECNEEDTSAYMLQTLTTVQKNFGIWLKKGNHSRVVVTCADQATVYDLPDDAWHRVTCVGQAGDTDLTVKFGLVPEEGESVVPVGAYIYAFGAQGADANYHEPTSYIPTDATAVTRNAENGTFDATNSPAATGNWAIAFDVKFKFYNTTTAADNNLVSSASGITRIFRLTTAGLPQLVVNGVTINGTALAMNTWYRIVMTGNGTNFRLFVNGAQQGADTAHGGVPGATTAFSIGSSTKNFCHMRNLRTYAHYASSSDVNYL